jgi:hypothetical protein
MTDAENPTATLEVPDDARVAAAAAVSTIALTFSLKYVAGVNAPFLARLAPLAPYFARVFASRIDLGGIDTVRTWSILSVAIAIGVFAFYAV